MNAYFLKPSTKKEAQVLFESTGGMTRLKNTKKSLHKDRSDGKVLYALRAVLCDIVTRTNISLYMGSGSKLYNAGGAAGERGKVGGEEKGVELSH